MGESLIERINQMPGRGQEAPYAKTYYGPTMPFVDLLSAMLPPDYKLPRNKWGAAQAYYIISYAEKCVELIATGIASLPLQVKRYTEEDRDRRGKWEGQPVAYSDDIAPQHPIFKFLHDYERNYHVSLILRIAIALTLFDECYLELVRMPARSHLPVSEGNPLLGLDWLNPLGMDFFEANGKIDRYWYTPFNGAPFVSYMPYEIAYTHGYNPRDDLRGYPDILAVMDSLNIDDSIQRAVLAHFRNGIQAAAVVSPKNTFGNMSAMRQELKNMRDTSRGVEQVGNFMFLPQDMEVNPLDYPDYAKLTAYAQDTKQRILDQFGVPEAVLGNSDIAGYKQGDEITYRFYVSNIIPRARQVTRYLNVQIMPVLPKEYHNDRLELDTSEFDRVSENDMLEAQLARDNLQAGIITINEARARQQLPELPSAQGDLFMLPTGVQLVAASDLKSGFAAQEMAPQEAPEGDTMEPVTVEGEPVPQLPDGKAAPDSAVIAMVNARDLQPAIAAASDAVTIGKLKPVDPDSYHITVAYSPVALPPDMVQNIPLDSGPFFADVNAVGTFDTPEGYALVLFVENTGAVAALNGGVTDYLNERGAPLSPFSSPDRYAPHVTLGYGDTPIPKTPIGPFKVPVSRIVVTHDHTPVRQQFLTAKSLMNFEPVDFSDDQATLDELNTLYRFITRGKRSTKHIRQFEFKYTRGWIADELMADLEDYDSAANDRTIKSYFDAMKQRILVKAIQATRIDFEDRFEDLLHSYVSGEITRRSWSARVRSLIRVACNKAFRDGMEDGGVETEEIAEEDQILINQHISDQTAHVQSLGKDVLKEAITLSGVAGKGSIWFNKSIMPMYQAGLASAKGNQMVEWVIGRTEKHCKSCLTYNGQRHRYKVWLRVGAMPQSDTLICGGYNCDCRLVAVRGKARGKLKLITKSIGKHHKLEEAYDAGEFFYQPGEEGYEEPKGTMAAVGDPVATE